MCVPTLVRPAWAARARQLDAAIPRSRLAFRAHRGRGPPLGRDRRRAREVGYRWPSCRIAWVGGAPVNGCRKVRRRQGARTARQFRKIAAEERKIGEQP